MCNWGCGGLTAYFKDCRGLIVDKRGLDEDKIQSYSGERDGLEGKHFAFNGTIGCFDTFQKKCTFL
jgi:hypothetical protein